MLPIPTTRETQRGPGCETLWECKPVVMISSQGDGGSLSLSLSGAVFLSVCLCTVGNVKGYYDTA